jgi:hypothetical protein
MKNIIILILLTLATAMYSQNQRWNDIFIASNAPNNNVRAIASDGTNIHSFLNIVKEQHSEQKDLFDIDKIKRREAIVQRELKVKEQTVSNALARMQESNPIIPADGMRPVFSIDRAGKVFVTDMDISVNKPLLESKQRVNNRINAVMGKSMSRAVSVYHGKKTNMMMLDAIEKDMYENYVDGKTQGSKNIMSYVKLGPGENNKLNEEIWGVIPRYMKVEIIFLSTPEIMKNALVFKMVN